MVATNSYKKTAAVPTFATRKISSTERVGKPRIDAHAGEKKIAKMLRGGRLPQQEGRVLLRDMKTGQEKDVLKTMIVDIAKKTLQS